MSLIEIKEPLIRLASEVPADASAITNFVTAEAEGAKKSLGIQEEPTKTTLAETVAHLQGQHSALSSGTLPIEKGGFTDLVGKQRDFEGPLVTLNGETQQTGLFASQGLLKPKATTPNTPSLILSGNSNKGNNNSSVVILP